jgi:hypothetical protein
VGNSLKQALVHMWWTLRTPIAAASLSRLHDLSLFETDADMIARQHIARALAQDLLPTWSTA